MVNLMLAEERRSQGTHTIGARVACGQYRPGAESSMQLAARPIVLRKSDDAHAVHLAHSYLVAACEQALFDLLCSAGEGKSPEDVRISLMASDVIREVLDYWRGRLDAAKAAVRANNLD